MIRYKEIAFVAYPVTDMSRRSCQNAGCKLLMLKDRFCHFFHFRPKMSGLDLRRRDTETQRTAVETPET